MHGHESCIDYQQTTSRRSHLSQDREQLICCEALTLWSWTWVGGERGGRWKKTVFFFCFFLKKVWRAMSTFGLSNHFTVLSPAIQTSEQFMQSTAFQTIKKMKRKTQHAVNTCIKLFKIRNARQRHVQQSWSDCASVRLWGWKSASVPEADQHTLGKSQTKNIRMEKKVTQVPHSELWYPATYLRGNRNSRLAMLRKKSQRLMPFWNSEHSL